MYLKRSPYKVILGGIRADSYIRYIAFDSLSYLRNKIILSKLEAVLCESYGLLFAWSPFGHYVRELLVKDWYKAHILLIRLNF